MSRPRSRRLGPPPGSVRGAWRALGDGSHIEIVTSGTDAEDGMGYQRRRAERAGGWRGRVMNPEPPNARPVNLGEPDRERLHGQRIHGRLPPKPCTGTRRRPWIHVSGDASWYGWPQTFAATAMRPDLQTRWQRSKPVHMRLGTPGTRSLDSVAQIPPFVG